MPTAQVMTDARKRMAEAIDRFQYELQGIRAGRANASLLDRVNVLYYGVPTPLNQLASITIPEARMLLITPYDASSLGDIERAIQQSDIGITPNNDGSVIRLMIPALTLERRQELTRTVGQEQEGAKVAVRNIRRDANEQIKKLEKDGEITEDGRHSGEKDVQKLTDEMTRKIDELAAEKNEEILDN